MASKSWKAWELRVAKLFGCKRRGPDFRGEHGGKDDLTHDRYAVEVKLLGRPCFADLLAACNQAEQASQIPIKIRGKDEVVERIEWQEREPIAIVKRLRDKDADALVCMRLETWLQWHPQGPPPGIEPESGDGPQ